MSKYYDLLFERYKDEDNIAEIVGRGLDRIGRNVTDREINEAEQFYLNQKESFDQVAGFGSRRELIEKYVNEGCKWFSVPVS